MEANVEWFNINWVSVLLSSYAAIRNFIHDSGPSSVYSLIFRRSECESRVLCKLEININYNVVWASCQAIHSLFKRSMLMDKHYARVASCEPLHFSPIHKLEFDSCISWWGCTCIWYAIVMDDGLRFDLNIDLNLKLFF